MEPGIETDDKLKLIIISAVSGAGRSTAEVALEDLGYFCISNLPTNLWASAVQQMLSDRDRDRQDPSQTGHINGLVLSIQSNPALPDSSQIQRSLLALRQWPELDIEHVHLVCDDDVLVRRFSTTRRRHPFAMDRPLVDGISAEKSFLAGLRLSSDIVIDTTLLEPKDLAHRMMSFAPQKDETTLVVGITTFAFGRGLPREADLVFDARFLRNPHYDPDLREMTGRDAEVVDYIKQDPDFQPYLDSIYNLLKLCLPRFERDGKSYLTIGVGCTGGKHRSIATAEILATYLSALGYPTTLRHREH